MFREMRRNKQMLSIDECIEILNRGTSGVLALSGDHGYPYAVPVSYVYCDSKLYFHSAKSGHKIDAIKKYSKASFCVIDQDNIIPEKYTTSFRSVIAFGKIHIIENETDIKKTIENLAKKYYFFQNPLYTSILCICFPAINPLEGQMPREKSPLGQQIYHGDLHISQPDSHPPCPSYTYFSSVVRIPLPLCPMAGHIFSHL